MDLLIFTLLGPGGPEESWTKSLKRDGTAELGSRGNTKKGRNGGGNVPKDNRHLLKEKNSILQIVLANLIPLECALDCRTKIAILQLFPWQQT